MEYNQRWNTVRRTNLHECNLFLMNVLWTREVRSWWPLGPHCRIKPSETRPSVFSSETCPSVRRKWTRRDMTWRYELSDHLVLEKVFAAKQVLRLRCFQFHWCLHRCTFVPNSFDCLLSSLEQTIKDTMGMRKGKRPSVSLISSIPQTDQQTELLNPAEIQPG